MAKISQISLDSISCDRLDSAVRANGFAIDTCRAPVIAGTTKKISHKTITIR
jgi:hypothetical protein